MKTTKRFIKKFLGIALAVAMVISMAPATMLTTLAAEDQPFAEVTGYNQGYFSSYNDAVQSTAAIREENIQAAKEDGYLNDMGEVVDTPRFSNEQLALDFLRRCMVERRSYITFDFPCTATNAAFSKRVDWFLTNVMGETPRANEGDYLRWHWGGYGARGYNQYDGYVRFAFTMDYLSSSYQEAKVDRKIAAIKKSSAFKEWTKHTDAYNTREIYKWVINNFEYDHRSSGECHSAAGGFLYGETVCQGYATSMYRLMREMGIANRVVASQVHGWNIVKLGGKYYNIDATWGDPGDNLSASINGTGKYNWQFFLKTDKAIKNYDDYDRAHTRTSDINGWNYTSSAFYNKYPMSSTNYKYTTSKDGKTATPPTVGVKYQTQVQSIGWQSWKKNGESAGTSGMGKRLETIKIQLTNSDKVKLGVQYRTHIQSYGWESTWKSNGAQSGTVGQGKRLEAIQIRLTGDDAYMYDIYYRVHAQSFGWLGWAKNGECAGTAGQGKRLEAIQIKVVKKGASAPSGVKGYSYIEYGKTAQENDAFSGLINYKAQVQSYGWQEYVNDGSLSGTFGEGKRLEALRIYLGDSGYGGSVQYRAQVQSYGWQSWKNEGSLCGTQGEGKRLEAIQIKLTGEVAKKYDVFYRVHAQSYGWLGWAKNGASAGTQGLAKRVEAIQIVMLPKGSKAPSASSMPAFVR